MANYTPRRLAQVRPSSTAETTIYTVPGAKLAIVKQIMVANVLPGSITVAASVVPSAGAAGSANRLFPDTSLPPKSVLVFDLSQVMETGDFISVQTSAADGAVFTVSGVETALSAVPEAGIQVFHDDLPIGIRSKLNLHESQFVDLQIVDDATAGELDITIIAKPQAVEFIQGVPANPWVINHNLGFRPSVTVVDSGGAQVEGDVTYPSATQVQIAFAGAFSGAAYLS